MRSNSSPSTLEHLFNELNQRADSSFQVLQRQQQKIAQLTQTGVALRDENQRLQSTCNRLDQSLQEIRAELASVQEASLQAAIAQTQAEAEQQQQESSSTETAALTAENEKLKAELADALANNAQLEQRLSDVQQQLTALAAEPVAEPEPVIEPEPESVIEPQPEPVAELEPEPAATTESGTEKFDAKGILAQWRKRYPKAFSAVTVLPLKIGIHEDLAAGETLPDHWIRRALASYVRSPRYLRVLKTGAVRMDLAGNNAGFVSADEAEHAQQQLDTVRVQRLEKEKAVRQKAEKKRMSSKLEQLLNKK